MYARTLAFALALPLFASFGCNSEAPPAARAHAAASTGDTYERAVLAMALPSLERQLRESASAPASWALNR